MTLKNRLKTRVTATTAVISYTSWRRSGSLGDCVEEEYERSAASIVSFASTNWIVSAPVVPMASILLSVDSQTTKTAAFVRQSSFINFLLS